jgi:hypothetical protein
VIGPAQADGGVAATPCTGSTGLASGFLRDGDRTVVRSATSGGRRSAEANRRVLRLAGGARPFWSAWSSCCSVIVIVVSTRSAVWAITGCPPRDVRLMLRVLDTSAARCCLPAVRIAGREMVDRAAASSAVPYVPWLIKDG